MIGWYALAAVFGALCGLLTGRWLRDRHARSVTTPHRPVPSGAPEGNSDVSLTVEGDVVDYADLATKIRPHLWAADREGLVRALPAALEPVLAKFGLEIVDPRGESFDGGEEPVNDLDSTEDVDPQDFDLEFANRTDQGGVKVRSVREPAQGGHELSGDGHLLDEGSVGEGPLDSIVTGDLEVAEDGPELVIRVEGDVVVRVLCGVVVIAHSDSSVVGDAARDTPSSQTPTVEALAGASCDSCGASAGNPSLGGAE